MASRIPAGPHVMSWRQKAAEQRHRGHPKTNRSGHHIGSFGFQVRKHVVPAIFQRHLRLKLATLSHRLRDGIHFFFNDFARLSSFFWASTRVYNSLFEGFRHPKSIETPRKPILATYHSSGPRGLAFLSSGFFKPSRIEDMASSPRHKHLSPEYIISSQSKHNKHNESILVTLAV